MHVLSARNLCTCLLAVSLFHTPLAPLTRSSAHNHACGVSYVPGRAGAAAAAAAAAAAPPQKPRSAHFPITEHVMTASVKLDGLGKTLANLNVSVSPELQLDSASIETLTNALSAIGGRPAAPFSSEAFAAVAPVCVKLLSWPAGDARVPGLDAVRVLMANTDFRNAAFTQDGTQNRPPYHPTRCRTHTHTHIHTYTRTYTHAHTHTHTRARVYTHAGTALSLPEFKAHMLHTAGLSGDGGAPESGACQMLALRALANAFGGNIGMHDCIPELLSLLERFDVRPLSKHAQVRSHRYQCLDWPPRHPVSDLRDQLRRRPLPDVL